MRPANALVRSGVPTLNQAYHDVAGLKDFLENVRKARRS
jgi:hypothetical protein